MANFELYVKTPIRWALLQASNDSTGNPRADDAGNWTGCKIGVGKLVGTYRDISACALGAWLGREATKEDLRRLTLEDAKTIMKKMYWDKIYGDQIPDQDTANIIMHIKMHFGNTKLVQRALNQLGENLVVDGQFGPKSFAALQRQLKKNTVNTYSRIRAILKTTYENSPIIYRKGFLRGLEDFPEKKKDSPTGLEPPLS